jgi:hypothetical protein
MVLVGLGSSKLEFKMSKRYNVTLNFTFEIQYPEYPDTDEEDSDEEDTDEGSDMESIGSIDAEHKRERAAFRRTEEYYSKNSLEEHVKRNDAFGFVEYICCDGKVLSAEWDEEKFQIHMVVETDQSEKELHDDIEDNSLEDGEYEACGDTGWIVMTRGPNGEEFDRPWDTTDFWTYALTDYRSNPIEVSLIKDEVEAKPKAE